MEPPPRPAPAFQDMSTYEVTASDRVYPLDEIPSPSAGAPMPLVLADEHRLVVAYRTANQVKGDDEVVLVTFDCMSCFFGGPNDEALSGHPLHGRGLQRYGAFVVRPSSWLSRTEEMNRVHPSHDPDAFGGWKHFILTFHDSLLECLAGSFAVEVHRGRLQGLIPRMGAIVEG